MNMKVDRIAIWIIMRYVLPFVEVEENDAIVFFCRILLRSVIHARLLLSKNSLLVWMILLLGKEHITLSTSSVLNVEIRFCPPQCLFLILKVKKLFFRVLSS
jgi:hypothetical protein